MTEVASFVWEARFGSAEGRGQGPAARHACRPVGKHGWPPAPESRSALRAAPRDPAGSSGGALLPAGLRAVDSGPRRKCPGSWSRCQFLRANLGARPAPRRGDQPLPCSRGPWKGWLLVASSQLFLGGPRALRTLARGTGSQVRKGPEHRPCLGIQVGGQGERTEGLGSPGHTEGTSQSSGPRLLLGRALDGMGACGDQSGRTSTPGSQRYGAGASPPQVPRGQGLGLGAIPGEDAEEGASTARQSQSGQARDEMGAVDSTGFVHPGLR